MQKKLLTNVKYMGNLIIETGRAADELNESADQMKQSSDAAVVTIDELKRIRRRSKGSCCNDRGTDETDKYFSTEYSEGIAVYF